MGKRTIQSKERMDLSETDHELLGLSGLNLQDMLWRVERLERQVCKLSELVRVHAENSDRLVQIVAEDREILHQELLLRLSSSSSPKLKHTGPSSDPIKLTSS